MTADSQAVDQVSGVDTRLLQSRSLKKQFFPNLVANGGVFALSILLGIWYTPYLIHHLGVAAYGLVPLANSLTSYLNLIGLSLNGAAGRFLTLDLEQKSFASANRTFNTVLFGNLGLVVLALPLVIGLVLGVPRWFDIPAGQEVHTQWLFATTLVSYLITVIGSSFSVSSWARNRFDLRNIVVAVRHLVRVGLVVAAFSLTQPMLWHVGLGILVGTAIGFVGDVFVWRRLTPQLSVQPPAFDFSRVRELFGMGGWLIVNEVGTLLFLNVDLIVANTLLGAKIAGEYGSVLLFSTMLRRLAQTASSVLTPTVMAKYAQGDIQVINRILQQAVKLMGLALALPIGLLCGLAAPLLTLWLGPEFQGLARLLLVLTLHLSINLAVLPLFGLNKVLNKVRLPGIVTVLMGVMNAGLAVAFVKLGWGAIGVAAAGAIALTLKNVLFTPVYAATIQRLPWWTFLTTMFLVVAAALLVGGMAQAVTHFVNVNSWLRLSAVGGGIGILYVVAVYFGVLSQDERGLLMKLTPLKR